MSNISRELLFYFKYWDEMVTFYSNEDYTLLADNREKEDLIEEIKKVGAMAEQGANLLLNAIQAELRAKIPPGYELRPIAQAAWRWERKCKIWPTRSRLPDRERRLEIGVFIEPRNGNVLHSWVWVRGGRAGLEALRRAIRVGNVEKILHLPAPTTTLSGDREVNLEPVVDEVVGSFKPAFENIGSVWKIARNG